MIVILDTLENDDSIKYGGSYSFPPYRVIKILYETLSYTVLLLVPKFFDGITQSEKDIFNQGRLRSSCFTFNFFLTVLILFLTVVVLNWK